MTPIVTLRIEPAGVGYGANPRLPLRLAVRVTSDEGESEDWISIADLRDAINALPYEKEGLCPATTKK